MPKRAMKTSAVMPRTPRPTCACSAASPMMASSRDSSDLLSASRRCRSASCAWRTRHAPWRRRTAISSSAVKVGALRRRSPLRRCTKMLAPVLGSKSSCQPRGLGTLAYWILTCTCTRRCFRFSAAVLRRSSAAALRISRSTLTPHLEPLSPQCRRGSATVVVGHAVAEHATVTAVLCAHDAGVEGAVVLQRADADAGSQARYDHLRCRDLRVDVAVVKDDTNSAPLVAARSVQRHVGRRVDLEHAACEQSGVEADEHWEADA
eukprot:scaffold451_cov208-Pinguiococcus_pyrenoidosus.AAC.6